MKDPIERQAAIEALCSDCQGRCIPCESYPCSEVEAINALPSAQPEITKGDLMKAIQAGIDAMQKNNVYECGMRNGMRWCKALLGEKLDFEDPLQYCKQEGEIDG